MKTYTVKEIEQHCAEMDAFSSRPQGSYASEMLRQLLAERSQIRKQAFEEAAEIAKKVKADSLLWGALCKLHPAQEIEVELRRKAEEELGNGGRVDVNDPNDISA